MKGQNYNFQKVDKRLITNSNDLKFLECLKEEIRTCKSFKFVIAFIKYSGLQLIIEALNQCNEKGIKGEIITSNYLYSTQPYAIKQLMEFKNIDVKIVDVNEFSGGLHAKSYYFEHENNVSIYVGSNNLSKAGLKENTEWILHNFVDMNSEISKRFIYEFEQLRDLSQIPLDRYREMYNENLKRNKEIGYVIDKYIKVDESSKVIVKNSMQLEVLLKLEKLRRDSENKGLVIAATGTGKTYLSAFDAKAFNAKRLLFVVHNKEIAANARKTFEEIFLETRTYGFACDGEFEIDKDFVFALPRTINNNIDKIDENLFDYIIFDEAHRVASDGHQRIYNHFKPKFILGMTATPERMDGKDIYNYFDDNIVSNIRLKNALNNNLLVPFHYFGISDDVEYEASDFNNLREMTRKLNVNKRSEFIINKMEMYGYTAESKRKCLAFCATKEHAVYMCDKFKEKGYNAVILTGESSTIDRSNSIKNLMDENNELEFIFTVDIFNEGVDIPGVNLILMLRPTNSATIFIQQLGRGLRKFKNKEFLTVLDFIGNHSNNYVMTYAFSDGNIYDPSSMRAKIKSGQWGFKDNVHIEIDKKSVDSILESIDKIDFSSKRYLKNMYESFKNEFESNKKIYLRDFLLHSYSPDPLKFTHSKDKNYYDFVNKIEREEIFSVSPSVRSGINYLMTIAPLRRSLELKIIKILLNGEIEYNKLKEKVILNSGLTEKEFLSAYNFLKYVGFTAAERHTQGLEKTIITDENNIVKLGIEFKNEDKEIFIDFVDYLLNRYYNEIGENKNQLVLYQTYTHKTAALVLGSNMKRSIASFREGVCKMNDTFQMFINLKKDESINESINYKDEFINNKLMAWESQGGTSIDSNSGKELISYVGDKSKSWDIFVRKSKDKIFGETPKYIYLGKGTPLNHKNSKPIHFEIELENEVPDDIYSEFMEAQNKLV